MRQAPLGSPPSPTPLPPWSMSVLIKKKSPVKCNNNLMAGNKPALVQNNALMLNSPSQWRAPIMGLVEKPGQLSTRKQCRAALKIKYKEKSWR